MQSFLTVVAAAAALMLASSPSAADVTLSTATNQDWGSSGNQTHEEVIQRTLVPFRGASNRGVDASTLHGKIMCGYQGWFSAKGDDSGRGWSHWTGTNGFRPSSCGIDLWPDMSELEPEERYVTEFRHADGTAAEVFSSFNRKTVLRHFRWMKEYGIDGVFVQRFIADLSTPKSMRHVNVVLNHCREGANLHGRAYAVMYDLSGMGAGEMDRVISDWKNLVDRMQIAGDAAYLRHRGRPVVSIWGFGFNDGRKYTAAEGLKLVDFLKHDPRYGGCTVMLGVPTYWRTLDRDCVGDPKLHELIRRADIVSPWTVGRYGNPSEVKRHAELVMKPDMEWCRRAGKDYLPVAFPGFSWHNLRPPSPLNQIPRLKGEFLRTQYREFQKAGATMVYLAMFDEVDEGTAIFKCSNNPPVGESSFIDYEGLPSDFYLKLVGEAGRKLRGEAALE